MSSAPWIGLVVMLSGSTALADGGVIQGTIEISRQKDVPAGAILVYVVGFAEPPPRQPVSVRQVGRRFVPDLVAVTLGGTVAFPNGDPFLHNVFSPTTERNFDLGSFPQGDTRSRTFPRMGVLDVYCNIHPEMTATLVILPNTRFAIADAKGRFELTDVPVGTWSVFAYSRRAVKPVSAKATITSGGITEVMLKLDEVQREFKHRNKYGETYRENTTIYAPGT